MLTFDLSNGPGVWHEGCADRACEMDLKYFVFLFSLAHSRSGSAFIAEFLNHGTAEISDQFLLCCGVISSTYC